MAIFHAENVSQGKIAIDIVFESPSCDMNIQCRATTNNMNYTLSFQAPIQWGNWLSLALVVMSVGPKNKLALKKRLT
jgi:hypothetical protein